MIDTIAEFIIAVALLAFMVMFFGGLIISAQSENDEDEDEDLETFDLICDSCGSKIGELKTPYEIYDSDGEIVHCNDCLKKETP